MLYLIILCVVPYVYTLVGQSLIICSLSYVLIRYSLKENKSYKMIYGLSFVILNIVYFGVLIGGILI